MKYVVLSIKSNNLTREIPVIFPNALVHSDMYKKVKEALLLSFPGAEIKPVSAGELSLYGAEPRCNGHSGTLGIKSREHEDDQLMQMIDYGFGTY